MTVGDFGGFDSVSNILDKLCQRYGNKLQASDLITKYREGNLETDDENSWLTTLGAQLSARLLMLSLDELCAENVELRAENLKLCENNNGKKKRSTSQRENKKILEATQNFSTQTFGKEDPEENNEGDYNASQMIDEFPSQSETQQPKKKKSKRSDVLYESPKEIARKLEKRKTEKKSVIAGPSQTKPNQAPVNSKNSNQSLIQKKKALSPQKTVYVPETIPNIEESQSLLARVPRVPDTPEKGGFKVPGILPVSTQKKEEEHLSQVIESSSGEPDANEEGEEDGGGEDVGSSPIFFRAKGLGKGQQRMKSYDRTKVKKDITVEMKTAEQNEGRAKKLKTEESEGKAKKLKKERSSDEDSSSMAKSRKSNSGSVNVGLVTPNMQHKIDRKTWVDLQSDFSGGSKPNESATPVHESLPVDNESLCEESPNLMRPNIARPQQMTALPKPRLTKENTEASCTSEGDKENDKPKRKPKSKKSENRWGMSVEPLTDSTKKKMSSLNKQSTLDNFWKNGERPKSELEIAKKLSLEEYEASKKPETQEEEKKKPDLLLDNTMDLMAERERQMEEEAYKNKRIPPPLTPPGFWDPDIIQDDPDDPRVKTQQAPEFNTRANRRKKKKAERAEAASANKPTAENGKIACSNGKLVVTSSSSKIAANSNGKIAANSSGKIAANGNGKIAANSSGKLAAGNKRKRTEDGADNGEESDDDFDL